MVMMACSLRSSRGLASVAGYAPGGAAARNRQGAGWPGGDGNGPGAGGTSRTTVWCCRSPAPGYQLLPEEVNRRSAAARAHLDAATFEAGWAAGQAMTEEQAINFALQDA